MAVDRDRLDAALEETRALLGELVAELRGNVAQAHRIAQENQRRHAEARAALVEVERQLAASKSERSDLPQAAYAAFLDGQHGRAEKLRGQYQDLKPAIEALETQREGLRAEIRELCPKESIPGGHPLDAAAHQQHHVSTAIQEGLQELYELEQRYVIAPLLEGIADLEGRADNLRYMAQEWGREVNEARARHEHEKAARGARERLRAG